MTRIAERNPIPPVVRAKLRINSNNSSKCWEGTGKGG